MSFIKLSTNTMIRITDCSPTLDVGGDVVRFSLRCHVLSRRPKEIYDSLGLPELTLASQEDLDSWIN